MNCYNNPNYKLFRFLPDYKQELKEPLTKTQHQPQKIKQQIYLAKAKQRSGLLGVLLEE